MNREEVKSLFRSSFTRDSSSLVQRLADEHCSDCREVQRDFAALNWTEVSAELTDANFDRLSLLPPSKFVFYLPAFCFLPWIVQGAWSGSLPSMRSRQDHQHG